MLESLKRLAGQYLQCSFRGVPFAVITGGGQARRNLAEHAYPMRDGMWFEDLGKRSLNIRMDGLLCGPTCFAQRDLLQMAAETKGPGLLIHPRLGAIKAQLIDFEWNERPGFTNVVDVRFGFFEVKNVLGATITAVAHVAVGAGITAYEAVSTKHYKATARPVFAHGYKSVTREREAAQNWVSRIKAYCRSPQMMSGATSIITQSGGRYAPVGIIAANEVDDKVIIEKVVQTRADFDDMITRIDHAVDPETISGIINDCHSRLNSTLPNPSDRKTFLRQLVGLDAQGIGPTSGPTQNYCRQSSLAWLVKSCADWTPSSSTEAETARSDMSRLLNEEATRLAQKGEDEMARQTLSLRTAITADLAARGSKLPDILTISRNVALPALSLSQQIYASGLKTGDLIRRADPVHPAFMPETFEALAP